MSTLEQPIPEVPYASLLGQVIRQQRQAKNILPTFMAEKLDLSQPSYSRIETGDTTMNVWQLRTCASALGITVTSIMEKVERLDEELRSQNVKVVEAKKTVSPAAFLIGAGLLIALLSRL